MRWKVGQVILVFASVWLVQGQTTRTSSQQQPVASQLPVSTQSEHQQTASFQSDQSAEKDKSGHKWHVRLGTVSAGAGYTYVSNPFFGPFWPYGFYGPGWFYPAYYGPYDPFYGGYLPALSYADDKGKVELAVLPKTADVYVNGAYAGPAGNLKKFWLDPGAYDLTVSTPGGTTFHERIYVLSGKSVKIKHTLMPQNVQEKQ